jgi:hypothetical protein
MMSTRANEYCTTGLSSVLGQSMDCIHPTRANHRAASIIQGMGELVGSLDSSV